MIRVTAGTAKGRKLKIPDIPGFRPPQDLFKLAVFSILGEKVENSICLDLYAGSGSLGIEALSRGAQTCHFVDDHKLAQLAIQENLALTELTDKAEVYRQDAVKFASNASKIYDIIFIDPFYQEHSHKFLFQNLEEILTDTGVIVFSHGKELNIENVISNTKLKLHTQRKYGAAHLTILTH